jgi:ribosomal protein L40E
MFKGGNAMDFISKVGATLSGAGKDVTQKARDLTDVARLKMEIRSKEDFIKRQYESIGSKYYEAHKEDEATPFDEIFLITQTLSEIESVKKELASVKGYTKCASCGAELDPAAAYCSKCGSKNGSEADVVDNVGESSAQEETEEEKDEQE